MGSWKLLWYTMNIHYYEIYLLIIWYKNVFFLVQKRLKFCSPIACSVSPIASWFQTSLLKPDLKGLPWTSFHPPCNQASCMPIFSLPFLPHEWLLSRIPLTFRVHAWISWTTLTIKYIYIHVICQNWQSLWIFNWIDDLPYFSKL